MAKTIWVNIRKILRSDDISVASNHQKPLMRHSIENHRLRISIDEVGAELASLVNFDSGKEYIWQADPAVWGSHAPVLFPIIGVLKDGETKIDGKTYRIPKHGMVRRNDKLELFKHLIPNTYNVGTPKS